MTRFHQLMKPVTLALPSGLLLALVCFCPPGAAPQYDPSFQDQGTVFRRAVRQKGGPLASDNSPIVDTTLPMSAKQKRYLAKANFEKSKSDAAELAALAKVLREDLNRPKAQGLSLEAVARIDKIQKLAKKIRDETKGY